MTFEEWLTSNYKYSTNKYDQRDKDIERNLIDLTESGIKEFNEIYLRAKQSDLSKIVRTEHGCISTSSKNMLNNTYAWDIDITNGSSARLTILIGEKIFVFSIAHNNKEKGNGKKMFHKFKKFCYKKGINMDDYIIDNGEEVKKEIERPYIMVYDRFLNKTLTNVHHIDFHSSYPAGLVNSHPEFKNIIKELYQKREINKEYKDMLNMSIGCMQSLHKDIGAKWAHLSRDAIADNNRRIEELAGTLYMNLNDIIGYNTDGIWYMGDIYHGEGEGPELGDWSNDHTNCTFRAKSNGAYEYIENGKYHPVVRGETRLDRIKDRDTEWVWGDIYQENAEIIEFEWTFEKGFIIKGE